VNVVEVAGAVIVVAGAGSVLVKAIMGLFRTASRIEKVWEVVNRELTPNGGHSVKDQLNRMDARLVVVEEKVHVVENKVSKL
jgi:hypothetical protein